MPLAPPRPDCLVTAYARGIAEGGKPACKWVVLACQRHLQDLASGRERGLRWDQRAADVAMGFFKLLKHSKGRQFGGKEFVLSDWQQFIIGSLWGWKRANGTRRFREAWVEVPRKNGKTTLASGVGLILLLMDGEPGAEVYSAATKRDQARLSHSEAKRMVKASPALAKRVVIYKDALSIERTNSKYIPLGGDADSTDGLNPSGLILDEVHAWKGREFWDVLDTAMGARDQPLKFCITTAGSDGREESVYAEQHKYAKNVLAGTYPDDSLFAVIYTIDEGDDWTQEEHWIKANPNYGISVNAEYLQDKFRKAKGSPASQNAFKRLYLNVQTRSVDGWLPMDCWDRCGEAFDPAELIGRSCWGGLDIANNSDLAALVLVFPDGDEYRLLCFFWCPENARTTRGEKLRELLAPWIQGGFIEATEGNEIDLAQIEERIEACASIYNLCEVVYDPWNATATARHLMDRGIRMVKFTQNIRNYNEPSQLLEKLVRDNRLRHNGNPVLTWMAGNVTIRSDGVGNLMPDRKKSANKIDGIPAAIMALSQAALNPGGEPPTLTAIG